MNNSQNWGAWGSYDTSDHYSPREQIAALAAPILEGSDPSVLTPSYLLTRDQIRDTRLDAIVGGYYSRPVSTLSDDQRAHVGDYWRRAELVRTMTPSQRHAMIGGVFRLPSLTTSSDGTVTFELPRANTRREAPPPGPAVGPTGPKNIAPLAAPKRTPFAARLSPSVIKSALRSSLPYRRPGAAVVQALLSAPLLAPPPSPSPNPDEDAESFFYGFEEAIAAAASLEEVLGLLVSLDEEQLAAVLTQYPELLELLQGMGYFAASDIAADEPTEIGAACCSACARDDAMRAAGHVQIGDAWGDIARAVSMVDQTVIEPVWQAVKAYVPYGQVFDQLHEGRMGLLREHASEFYASPENARPTAAPVSTLDAMILDLQGLSRAVRRGDVQAATRAAALKDAASRGNLDAVRRWNAYAAIARDDERRLEQGRS